MKIFLANIHQKEREDDPTEEEDLKSGAESENDDEDDVDFDGEEFDEDDVDLDEY
jgi:hypothetical protein